MKIATLPIAAIFVGERLRAVDADWVKGLALSIEALGLQSAIVVGPPDDKGQHRLIAGAHRLAACQLLGWIEIPATIARVNQIERRLIEISENLHRRDLSVIDRAASLAEWQHNYEALHPMTKRAAKARHHKGLRLLGNYFHTETGEPRFDLEAAEKMRMSDRHVRNYLRFYRGLLPELLPALAASRFADRYSELARIARLNGGEQRQVVAALLRAEAPARSVHAALEEIRPARRPATRSEAKFQALMAAWARCDRKARRKFLAHLDDIGLIADLLAAQEAPQDAPPPVLAVIQGGR